MTSEKKEIKLVSNIKYGGPYQQELIESQRTGTCIFCKSTFQSQVLCEYKGWILLRNTFPAMDSQGGHAQFHFLAVPKKHSKSLWLNSRGLAAASHLFTWARNTYEFEGGAIFQRVGSPKFSGMTVCHPHVHLVVPRLDANGDSIPVYMAVG